MLSQLQSLVSQALTQLQDISDHAALQSWHKSILGKNGLLSEYTKQMKTVPADQKASIGQQLHSLKTQLEQAYQAHLDTLPEITITDHYDPYKPHITTGTLHPLTHTRNQIIELFLSQGYQYIDGPDIDDTYNNFDFLNTPPSHPSRHDSDTFYFQHNKDLVLRTHTSCLQKKAFEHFKTILDKPSKTSKLQLQQIQDFVTQHQIALSDTSHSDHFNLINQFSQLCSTNTHQDNLRAIMCGNVYRRDHDATHLPMFTQFEGLMLGENYTMEHLKGWIMSFIHQLLPNITDIRFRPSFFPFTYCSAEVDIKINNGDWLEVLGCGLTHPDILERTGIDSSRYQALAFGMGIERITMLKYGITDMKLLHDNDPLWLSTFSCLR